MESACARRLQTSTVLLFFIVAALPSAGQDVALALAGQLASAGAYDAAITEYRRFLFFHASGADAWQVEHRVADCYRSLDRYPEAIAWYERSARHAPDALARIEPELDAASVEIAARSWSAAEFRMMRLRASLPADILAGRDLLLLGLAYLGDGRAEDADRELSSYAASLPAVPREDVENVLQKWRAEHRLRPNTAKLLSTFLPGAGQVYAGHPLDGLNSLAVNAGSTTLVAWAVATGNYPEAALAFLYLLQRYYAGSRQNAEKQAIEHNQRIDRALAREILEALAAAP